jgi:Tfp pilus assembly protein PilO
MFRQNKKLLAYLILGGIILNIAGYWYLSQAKKATARLDLQIINAQQEKSDLEQLQAKFSELENKVPIFTSSLPEEGQDIALFLDNLNLIAQRENLDVEIEVKDQKSDDKNIGSKSLEMTVEAKGNFENIRNLMDQLSGLPYFFKLESLDIKPLLTGGVTAIFQLNLYTL